DPVQIDLAEQRIGQQAALAVVERDTGFVAGGFQAQYQHGGVSSDKQAANDKPRPGTRPALFTGRLCIPAAEAVRSAALENRRHSPGIAWRRPNRSIVKVSPGCPPSKLKRTNPST